MSTPPSRPAGPADRAAADRPVTDRATAPRTTAGASARPDLQRPKTSAAATFALVFGLSALFCSLLVFLAPLGVVFGLIALILGIAGISMSNRPAVTGKGVAIGGLVLGLLGLLLGAAIMAGAAVWFNEPQNVERLEQQLQQLQEELPTEVPSP